MTLQDRIRQQFEHFMDVYVPEHNNEGWLMRNRIWRLYHDVISEVELEKPIPLKDTLLLIDIPILIDQDETSPPRLKGPKP